MSKELVDLTWSNFPGGGSKRSVLMAIAEFSNSAGTCYVAMAEIGGAALCSHATVGPAIRWLRDEKWVVASRILGPGRGNLLAYALNIPKLQRSVRPDRDQDVPQTDTMRAARNARERRTRKYGNPIE